MAFLHVAIILLIALAGSCAKQQVIYVNSEAERNEDACIYGGSSLPCKTLEYVSKKVNKNNLSNIKIWIQNSPVEVYGVVEFQSISNITLDGHGSQIKCGSKIGAGFLFHSVQNLVLKDLTICNCRIFKKSTQNRTAAVHVLNSKHVAIHNVAITSQFNSNMRLSIALLFSNTSGNVTIQRSQFTNSGIQFGGSEFYAGGVYIEFDYCPVNFANYPWSEYLLDNCLFKDNTGKMQKPAFGPTMPTDFIGYGIGGGLSLAFMGNSCCNEITISDCNFARNNVSWGGGLHVQFQDNSQNNRVTVDTTNFTENMATIAGGGAHIGYIASSSDYQPPLHNFVYFYNTRFVGNDARYGGGTAIYASRSANNASGDTVRFVNCTWEENSAYIGASVDVSPFSLDTHTQGFLIIPVFIDCNFTGNLLTQERSWHGAKHINTGSFVVTEFTIEFGGHIIFRDNMYSALEISSGVAKFQSGTNVLFFNNSGIRGGAIAMYGHSSLHVQNDSFFKFEQNKAEDVGAGIYHYTIDRRDFITTSTHSCFIHYIGLKAGDRKLTFNFIDNVNTASKNGVAIYTSSFRSCNYEWIECVYYQSTLEKFQCIGNFSFDEPELALGTPAIDCSYSELRREIPGREFSVPLSITDELYNEVNPVYRISMDSRSITANKMYTINRTLALYGSPGDNGTLTFHTVDFREISFDIKVKLQQCPPGYFFDKQAESCDCAAYYVKFAYQGIYKCNNSEFQAYIQNGFWAGYLPGRPVAPATLYTAHCPLGFCNYETKNCTSTKLQLLPGEAATDILDNFMCGDYRTGLLCGKCKSGLSAYYHSQQYKCGDSKQCHLGLLFYFLSELLPVTVVFITVIVFDVSFTSGKANGFIFFSQVLDSLLVDANGVIQFPSPVDKLSVGYKIVYGLFNLDFFSIEQLSFCLWKQATVLDALAFKYVTVAFAFALVMCLVLHCKNTMVIVTNI